MQFKVLLSLAALSATALAAANPAAEAEPTPVPQVTVTFTNGADYSKAVSEISSYDAEITTMPLWSSFVGYITTALPTDPAALQSLSQIAISDLTGTAAPAWYTAMPADLQSFVTSVVIAEESIAIAVADGGAGAVHVPRGGIMAAGAVIAGMMLGAALL